MPEYDFVPVDHDPFTYEFHPVDHDPFASGYDRDSALAASMTHQAEQPNPAAPYLQDARNFASGGVYGVLKGRGVETPQWMDRGADFLHDPDFNMALGVMTPLKGTGISGGMEAGRPLLVERWGDVKSPMTRVPVEWRKSEELPWKFGIDDNGQAFVSGKFMPAQTKIQRYIDDYIKPLGDDVFFRSTLRKEDYEHLSAGIHRGSLNHATGEAEGGLSVARTPEFPSNYGYFVKGRMIGQGTDGEPLLDLATAAPVSKLMKWDEAQRAFSKARKNRLAELGLSDEQYRALISGGYITRPGTGANTEAIYGPAK